MVEDIASLMVRPPPDERESPTGSLLQSLVGLSSVKIGTEYRCDGREQDRARTVLSPKISSQQRQQKQVDGRYPSVTVERCGMREDDWDGNRENARRLVYLSVLLYPVEIFVGEDHRISQVDHGGKGYPDRCRQPSCVDKPLAVNLLPVCSGSDGRRIVRTAALRLRFERYPRTREGYPERLARKEQRRRRDKLQRNRGGPVVFEGRGPSPRSNSTV